MAVSVRRRAAKDFVVADCLADDVAGDVIRITGDAVGEYYQVSKLSLTNSSPELPIGLIISKLSSTRCIVQVAGEVSGIYTGLIPGGMLFVGDDSRLTHTVPSRPVTGVKSIYHAAVAVASDVLLLNFQPPTIMVS